MLARLWSLGLLSRGGVGAGLVRMACRRTKRGGSTAAKPAHTHLCFSSAVLQACSAARARCTSTCRSTCRGGSRPASCSSWRSAAGVAQPRFTSGSLAAAAPVSCGWHTAEGAPPWLGACAVTLPVAPAAAASAGARLKLLRMPVGQPVGRAGVGRGRRWCAGVPATAAAHLRARHGAAVKPLHRRLQTPEAHALPGQLVARMRVCRIRGEGGASVAGGGAAAASPPCSGSACWGGADICGDVRCAATLRCHRSCVRGRVGARGVAGAQQGRDQVAGCCG